MKFTQEIKDNWLKALKSGDYKQGFTGLVVNEDNQNVTENSLDVHYCCIGVLGACTEGLDNSLEDGPENIGSPYGFLRKTIGNTLMQKLYDVNDALPLNKLRDYSNVIPLIEALEVQE